MTTKAVSRPKGRPPLHKVKMTFRELHITQETDDAAVTESQKTGLSIAQVYRQWIEKGRKRK